MISVDITKIEVENEEPRRPKTAVPRSQVGAQVLKTKQLMFQTADGKAPKKKQKAVNQPEKKPM